MGSTETFTSTSGPSADSAVNKQDASQTKICILQVGDPDKTKMDLFILQKFEALIIVVEVRADAGMHLVVDTCGAASRLEGA